MKANSMTKSRIPGNTVTPFFEHDLSPCQYDEDLTRCIAEAAYFKAEARGFEPGHEVEDWLGAEKELLQ